MNFQQKWLSVIDIKALVRYIFKTHHWVFSALVAQSVEHIVGNDEVSGPIPLGSYKILLI